VLTAPALQILGKISYSIYLLQYLVIFNAIHIIYSHPYLFGGPISRLLFAVGMVILIVPLAAVTYRFIEVPGIGWAQSRARATLGAALAPNQLGS
jgi:peptidoglycan/LPS O-acetylase OafA/YrhL